MRAKHLLKYLLHSADIPKSSSYYHIGRHDPAREAKAAVNEVYHRHKRHYGQERIGTVLSWNKKKVQRIMGLLGLKAKMRGKKPIVRKLLETFRQTCLTVNLRPTNRVLNG